MTMQNTKAQPREYNLKAANRRLNAKLNELSSTIEAINDRVPVSVIRYVDRDGNELFYFVCPKYFPQKDEVIELTIGETPEFMPGIDNRGLYNVLRNRGLLGSAVKVVVLDTYYSVEHEHEEETAIEFYTVKVDLLIPFREMLIEKTKVEPQ